MPFFTLNDLTKTFKELGRHIPTPTTGYLLGGGAMAILGAKAATKDLDLVFRDEADRVNVEKGLAAMGAKQGEDRHSVDRVGSRRLWVTPDGMGWDLFVENIIGFQLYPQDYATATPWITGDKLAILQLSPELIFTMKAFTPRTRDIDDMYALLSSGLVSSQSITNAVRRRLDSDRMPSWLPSFYQGVTDMAIDRDVDVQWIHEFEDLASDALLANRIIAILKEDPLEQDILSERLSTPRDQVLAVLNRLGESGHIQRGTKGWRLLDHPTF